MRIGLVLIAVFLFSFSIVFGETPLVIRVLEVDSSSGKISAQILEGSANGIPTENSNEIIIKTPSNPLMNRLLPGDVMRVWGEFSEDLKVFSAQKISSADMGNKKDPTGVRRRLSKGRANRGMKGGGRGRGR